MANSYYQTPTRPRLYVSYPLWQYANGGLDYYSQDGNNPYEIPEEDFIRLIHLDPSDLVQIEWESGSACHLGYSVVPLQRIDYRIPQKLWNFNYGMVLNHNLASARVSPYFMQENINQNYGNSGTLTNSDIINGPYCTDYAYKIPEYDGFSAVNLTNGPITYSHPIFQFSMWGPPVVEGDPGQVPAISPVSIGTVMWGKYFDFPQNCDLNTSLSYNYGTKTVKNIGGKSINISNWTKTDGWFNTTTGGTEPFGLRKPIAESIIDHDAYLEHDLHDTADSFRRKSGLRVWNISFDSLAPEYVMNQNPMMNSQGWDSNFDNYDVDSDGITSTYNIDGGPRGLGDKTDFYTDVVHKTNGGSLPMVMQIDKDDNSAQNFAIVKMSDYTITQKSPNLYNISLVLEEQV